MLQLWCTNTSLNGVSDLYTSYGKRRHFVFWICVMILMVALTVYLTVLNIFTFFNTPSVTKMETVIEKQMEMPEIMLCYKGGLNVARLKSYKLSKELIKALQGGYMGPAAILKNESIETEFIDFLHNREISIREFYENIAAHDCEDIILSKFSTGGFNPDTRCDSNISTFVGEDTYSCLHFFDNGLQHVPEVDKDGFRLTITSPNGSETTKRDYVGLTNSFTMSLEKSFTVQGGVSIEIPLGYTFMILLSLTRITRLGMGRTCYNHNSHKDQTEICHKEILTNLMLNYCNCTFPNMYSHKIDQDNLTVCSVFDFHKKCLPYFEQAKYESVLISRKCLQPCEEFLYSTSLSFSPLDSTNVTKIAIGFAQIQFTKVEEVEAFTWDVALANVGGQAGLWMGCSVVTIVQAFFYAFLCICPKMPTPLKKSIKVDKQKETMP